MIYIACAMYPEAAPFIRRFACKKNDSFRSGQVFRGDEAVVILTGTSPVPAAIALTEALALLPPSDTDCFANAGLCGCSDSTVEPGTVFLIHSITEDSTGRTFYPDILYRHEFPQAALTTYAAVKTAPDSGAFLFDLEAAGLYQAAIPYFPADRMWYFKIVSDHGTDSGKLTKNDVAELMDACAPVISDALLRFSSFVPRGGHFSDEDEAVIASFCSSLHCSVTMEHELRRLIQYYELERGGAVAHLREFIASRADDPEAGLLLRSRKEGKDVLDEFRLSCLR